MAISTTNGGGNCAQCSRTATVRLGCEIDTNGDQTADVIAWGDIPQIETVNEAIADNAATERRNNDTDGESKVTPCGETTRVSTFTVTAMRCPDKPPSCYGKTGDIVWVCISEGRDAATGALTGEICEFKAEMTLPPKALDNNGDDPAIDTWTFVSTSDIKVYNSDPGMTCPVGTLGEAIVAAGGAFTPYDTPEHPDKGTGGTSGNAPA